jgi:NTF2 fold immunity protein
MKNFFTILFVFSLISCNNVLHDKLGVEVAKEELKNALLADTTKLDILDKKELLIKNENTAISIAEPILFDIYGKSKIEDEKPYEVYLIDNYWVIRGTLNRFSFGGTFVIIIDARNSKVLKIIHYK